MPSLSNQGRVERADLTIQNYGSDVCESNLIDFLTDAMHWCDANDEDFIRCLKHACTHYLHEVDEDRRDTSRLLSAALEPIEPANVHNLLAEQQRIAIVWGIDDVLQQRPDLTSDQAWQVLQRCERSHDCNFGMTWNLIDAVAEGLYPTPDDSLTYPAKN